MRRLFLLFAFTLTLLPSGARAEVPAEAPSPFRQEAVAADAPASRAMVPDPVPPIPAPPRPYEVGSVRPGCPGVGMGSALPPCAGGHALARSRAGEVVLFGAAGAARAVLFQVHRC